MSTGRQERDREGIDLIYPRHRFRPEEFLSFIEMPEFSADWEELGLNVDEDLCCLQVGIMAAPKAHPEIPDTGGIRVLEGTAIDDDDHDDRVDHFVYYVYFEEFKTVLLIMASCDPVALHAEHKAELRAMIEEQHAVFARGPVKLSKRS